MLGRRELEKAAETFGSHGRFSKVCVTISVSMFISISVSVNISVSIIISIKWF